MQYLCYFIQVQGYCKELQLEPIVQYLYYLTQASQSEAVQKHILAVYNTSFLFQRPQPAEARSYTVSKGVNSRPADGTDMSFTPASASPHF